MNENLTPLEHKLLAEIVRPSISQPKKDMLDSHDTVSESLNFSTLLNEIQSFYKHNGGEDWYRLLIEAHRGK